MNAVILIDKPEGRTSRQVVDIVQKRLKARKAGHAGTLDPLATGLLVVCLNEATKLAQFLVLDNKEYDATMILGVRTDTWDREGVIIAEETPQADKSKILEVLESFRGRITQTVPVYSAVKYKGKPLYKWARKGIEVAAPAREVEIYSLEVVELNLPYVSFRVSCSKGTYIRSLCHDIGEIIGCGACLWSLRRTKSGVFSLRDALPLDRVVNGDVAVLENGSLISLVDALPALQNIEIGALAAEQLRLGRQLTVGDLRDCHRPLFAKGDVVKLITVGRHLVAMVETLFASDEIGRLSPGIQAARILRVFGTKDE